MMKIDACGLSCPEPVIQTLNAINRGARQIRVVVDNSTAMENIKRLATSKGFTTTVQPEGDHLLLTLHKD